MKIYIDYAKQLITKVDYDTAYEGDYETVVFNVLFTNFQSTDWYPTMSQLAPNGRSVGDFAPDEDGTDVTEDGITYKKFTFTCGAGWVMMVGLSNFFVWVNKFINYNLTKKCVGKVMLKINESTDGFFVWNPYLNPAVAQYMDELMEGVAHPAGVYTSEQIGNLTSDIGIVVCSTNGYWYYWDEENNRYTQGALYQAPFYSSENKLSSDFVDDTGHTNKFVTESEKAQITTNKNDIATLNTDKADKSDTYTKSEVNTRLNYKADKNNQNQTIVTKAIKYRLASCKTSNDSEPTTFLEDFNGEQDSLFTYMYKKYTIPKAADYASNAYGWGSTQKPFFQISDENSYPEYETYASGKNNRTGIGFGINTTNGDKTDIQIIPAFKYSNYNGVHQNPMDFTDYANNPLDPLIMFRPYFLFTPQGRIYDIDNAPNVYFGFNTDSYDSTKKSIILTAYNRTLRVSTKGVELAGTNAHFYEGDKQVATQEYVDTSIATLEAATGASIDLSLDTTNYKITAILKNSDGTTISTSTEIDLPLESVVVSGAYDDTTKKVILTLQNGSTIEFSVADLVSGLQTEITVQNKLNADLVNDTNSAHKFVNASEKAQITANANNITALKNGTDDTNTINYSRTINQSFTSITHLSYDVVMTQENFNKINKNTIIVYTVYSSVDNASLEFYLRVKNAYIVVVNNEAHYVWNFEATYGLETGDGLFTMQFTASPSSLNNCDVDLYLTQTYTRDDITSQFLTDGEMATLLSEVFN